ncbi:hypothetical protein [Paracoccus sp. SCSIO 75233]|uniref:hypothetical protein n=1 Tax=Paracoccus sp. SCSIO 75233 TaxID=3017782 RepID=UPI0022F0126B|nr:hypothetical protein [Paracoccus sp. SCSIO 75233]WBU53007.1 hypothetical protein PAF12_14510 [Paracoccus sp. SCSIO 75233]
MLNQKTKGADAPQVSRSAGCAGCGGCQNGYTKANFLDDAAGVFRAGLARLKALPDGEHELHLASGEVFRLTQTAIYRIG